MKEFRNMLIDSSRITGSNVRNFYNLNLNDYDGILFPGWFGIESISLISHLKAKT